MVISTILDHAGACQGDRTPKGYAVLRTVCIDRRAQERQESRAGRSDGTRRWARVSGDHPTPSSPGKAPRALKWCAKEDDATEAQAFLRRTGRIFSTAKRLVAPIDKEEPSGRSRSSSCSTPSSSPSGTVKKDEARLLEESQQVVPSTSRTAGST